MIYFFLFLAELILLFFLSKRLINSLARIIFRIFKSHSAVVNILAIIFLPGTIFHELAHLLTAGILLVPVGEINVLPELEEKGVKLGSVQIARGDPIRRMLIGVAPVLLGTLTIFGLLYFMQFSWWQILLSLYLIFEISNTMFSSKQDIAGSLSFALAVTIVTVLALGGLYFLNQDAFQNLTIFLSGFNFEAFFNFFKTAFIYLLVPLTLDIIIIVVTGLKPFPTRLLPF